MDRGDNVTDSSSRGSSVGDSHRAGDVVADELVTIGSRLRDEVDALVDRVMVAEEPLRPSGSFAPDSGRRAYLTMAIKRIVQYVFVERHPPDTRFSTTPDDAAQVRAKFEDEARAGLPLEACLRSTQVLERELWRTASR